MTYNYNRFQFAHRMNKYLVIEHTKKIYDTTNSGNFRKRPHEQYTERVTGAFYENFVKSCSFFNGFMGGTCKAYWGYTAAGYIPTRITTINPDRTEKYIDTFTFKFEY